MAKTSYRNRIELVQGTLDMLILRTLQWGPQHGHGVKVAIRASSEGELHVDHGSLYPALHRIEDRGWISSFWGTSATIRVSGLRGHCLGLENEYDAADAFMVLELRKGALEGMGGLVKFAPEFREAGC